MSSSIRAIVVVSSWAQGSILLVFIVLLDENSKCSLRRNKSRVTGSCEVCKIRNIYACVRLTSPLTLSPQFLQSQISDHILECETRSKYVTVSPGHRFMLISKWNSFSLRVKNFSKRIWIISTNGFCQSNIE